MTDDVKQETNSSATMTAPLKGLVGTKIGMTQIFINETEMVPVTVISAEGIVISQIKNKEKHGYNAVQVAYEDVLDRKLSKAELNHLTKKGVKANFSSSMIL